MHQSDGAAIACMSSAPAVHAAVAELIRTMHDDGASGPCARWGLVAAAALHLPGVRHASIMVVGRAGVAHSVASTDSHVLFLDRIQQRLGEGPGLDAASDGQVHRVDDLASEARWRRYSREALTNTPIRSIMALPLFTPGFPTCALTLCADRPDVFGADGQTMGMAFVADAGATVGTWLRERRFRRALTNRDVIGQAKGILMERFDIDSVAAFSLLAELAKNRGQSVSAIARALVRRKLDGRGTTRLKS